MQKQCKARPTTDLETCHHVFDIPIESRCSSSRNFKTTLDAQSSHQEFNLIYFEAKRSYVIAVAVASLALSSEFDNRFQLESPSK